MALACKGNTTKGATKKALVKGKTLAKTPLAQMSATTASAAAAATMIATAGDRAALPPRRSSRRGDAAAVAGELDLIARLNAANAADATMAELPASGITNATSRGRASKTKASAGAGASTAVAPGAKPATSKDAKGVAEVSEQEGGGEKAAKKAAVSAANDHGEGMEADAKANKEVTATPPPKKVKIVQKRKTTENPSAEKAKAALTRAGSTTVPASPPLNPPRPPQTPQSKIRGQIELSSAKPTTEFVHVIRNLLAKMQKTAGGTRLKCAERAGHRAACAPVQSSEQHHPHPTPRGSQQPVPPQVQTVGEKQGHHVGGRRRIREPHAPLLHQHQHEHGARDAS